MGSLFGGSSGNQTQQNQFQNQSQNQSTRYDPQYESYVGNIRNKATSAAETPWQGYDVNKMFAGFTPDQMQAFQQIRDQQGAYQGYFDQGKGALDKVAGYDPRAAAQPYLDRAGAGPSAWQAGALGTMQSMEGWDNPNVRAGYMNPYAEGALGRAQDLTNRNFMEKTMPAITSQFAKGTGALGRGNYGKFTGDAVRNLAGEQAGTAATMMDKAWWSAANQFGSDQNRRLQGAGQLGNLANQAINTDMNLGKLNSDITTGAVNTGINVANAYSTQAGALQNVNMINNNALLQAGNQQQQQNQLPLTAQYQQWQQEQKWPFEMINFLNSAQRGLSIPTTQSGSSNTMGGSMSSGSGSNNPSIAGSVLGVASAVNTLGGKGNVGGLERGYDAIFGPGSIPTPASQGVNIGAVGAPGGPFNQPTQARGGRIGDRKWRRVPRYYGGGAVSRYAVGGDVPVERGLMSRGRPPMPMGMPPGALPPGPFAGGGGLSMPPGGAPDMGGILSMMR
jgi:hypothetical protein